MYFVHFLAASLTLVKFPRISLTMRILVAVSLVSLLLSFSKTLAEISFESLKHFMAFTNSLLDMF